MKFAGYFPLFLAAVVAQASSDNGISKRQAPGNLTVTQLLLGPWSRALRDRTGATMAELFKSIPPKVLDEQLYDWTTKALNTHGGKINNPADTVPKRTVLPSRAKIANATTTTVKLRHGPYRIPSMAKKNAAGVGGGLINYPDLDIQKPCQACTIVGFSSGLEFADGSEASINKGIWLHHLVLLSIGPTRSDPTCVDKQVSLPHAVVRSDPKQSERIWASGNERTKAVFPDWGVQNAGYHVRAEDRFSAILDFMNDSHDEDKVIYLTMVYDVIEDTRNDFDDVKVVWLDVANCLLSEIQPPKETGSWNQSATWTSNIEGEFIGFVPHLHDGGAHLVLSADDQVVCDGVASYGGSPEFLSDPTAMSAPGSANAHISNLTTCGTEIPASLRHIKKGQKWHINAYYDYDKFKGMLNEKGRQETAMALGWMFVRVKK